MEEHNTHDPSSTTEDATVPPPDPALIADAASAGAAVPDPSPAETARPDTQPRRDFHLDMAADLRSTASAPGDEPPPDDAALSLQMLDLGEVALYGGADEPLDIDAALASVATLDQALAEQQASENAARLRAEAEAKAAEEAARRRAAHYFPQPPPSQLARGQLTSVLPAFSLIAVGAWLTLTLASGQSPTAPLIGGVCAAVAGLALLLQWLTSGRWARGAGLAGFLLLAETGVLAFLAMPTGPNAAGWPLTIVAFGAALLLIALLGQPLDGRIGLLGAAVTAAGLVVFAQTMELTSLSLTRPAQVLLPISIGLGGVLLLLPLMARRRG